MQGSFTEAFGACGIPTVYFRFFWRLFPFKNSTFISLFLLFPLRTLFLFFVVPHLSTALLTAVGKTVDDCRPYG